MFTSILKSKIFPGAAASINLGAYRDMVENQGPSYYITKNKSQERRRKSGAVHFNAAAFCNQAVKNI